MSDELKDLCLSCQRQKTCGLFKKRSGVGKIIGCPHYKKMGDEYEKVYELFLHDGRTPGYMRHLSFILPARSDEHALFLIAKQLTKEGFLDIYELQLDENNRRKIKMEDD